MKKGARVMAAKFFAKGLESSPDEPTRAMIEEQLKKIEKNPSAAGHQD